MKKRAIAKETIAILERGNYVVDGQTINIKESVNYAIKNTINYSPNEILLNSEHGQILKLYDTNFEVVNETTFAAAKRFAKDNKVACLNFASAKNPGGGFLNGAQAQEECLSRASGLYPCIKDCEFYDANRNCGTSLYTDHIIYSPNVPVFRDDNDNLINDPFLVSIITSPAVNAGAIKRNEKHNIEKIGKVMFNRMHHVLSLASQYENDTIILGAWGCGVFKNDTKEVAQSFHQLLNNNYKNVFKNVVFAVYDMSHDKHFITPFEEIFQ